MDDLLNKDISQKIYELIVYSYQHKTRSSVRFNIELNKRKEFFGQNKDNKNKLIPILTSSTFIRPHSLYNKDGEINELELENYASYLADLVELIVKSETDSSLKKVKEKILSNSNLSLESWLFQSNLFFSTYKIGTISYLAPKEIGNNYFIDIPFRNYLERISEILFIKGYNNFIERNGKINSFSWIYFKIKKVHNKLRVQFYLQEFLSSLNPKHPFIADNELRDFWIITLYIAIFYQKKIRFDEDQNYYDWEVEIVDKFNEDDEIIEIYWFYHEHHYEFLHKKGFLNFTLFRKTDLATINKEISKANSREYEYLEKNAEELYETNYNLIEAKVLETIVPFYTEGMKRQSLRSAIAEVMTRNLSHNIGSHVLSRMVDASSIDIDKIVSDEKLHYTSIKELNKGDNKKERINKKFEELKKEYWSKPLNQKFKTPELQEEINKFLKERAYKPYYNDLMSSFFSYLKTRQDLLADIATVVPQMRSSKWFVKEVMARIDESRLLLNRISGVEKFNYKFDLDFGDVLKDAETKDRQVAISNDIMGQHCIYIILENIIRNTAKHGQKHYNSTDHTDVIFTIRLIPSTADPSHYQVTIFDNIEINGYSFLKMKRKENKEHPYDWYENDGNEKYSTKNVSFDLEKENIIELRKTEYQLPYLKRPIGEREYAGSREIKGSIYDYYKISNIDQLVIQQNIWINEPTRSPSTFLLRTSALGLIEMKVCAAYLRSIPSEDVDAPEFDIRFSIDAIKKTKASIRKDETKLGLLRAVRERYDKETKSGSLGYRFYLPKSKELLIIDQKGDLWNSVKTEGKDGDVYSKFRDLESQGILLLKVNRGDNDTSWCYDKSKIYSHALMLTIGDIYGLFEKHKVPKRTIGYHDVEKHFEAYSKKFEKRLYSMVKYRLSLSLTDDPKAFIREVWRSYLTKKMLSDGIKEFGIRTLNHLFPDLDSGKIYSITYDHHGKKITEWQGKYYAIFESRFEEMEKLFVPIDKEGDSQIITQFKALDAALTNIAVIDERIQELAENEYTLSGGKDRLTYQQIWHYMNVFIPPKEDAISENAINLSVKTFASNYERRIIKLLQKEFGDSSIREKSGLDFIIIHLGVLEKILNAQQGKSKDKEDDITSLISNLAKAVSPITEVIITSGRAPSQLPPNVSFLSYSLLSQYLIEYRFKLFLSETIYAARPKN